MFFFMLLKLFRPPMSREAYTQRAIERAFPTGHWVEDAQDTEEDHAVEAEEATDAPMTTYVTLIGGTKYDEAELERYVRELPPDVVLITGGARGAEKRAVELAEELGLEHHELPPDKERYGKRAAAVNVEQVLCRALRSPVVLVGNGERTKAARSWLARANWGREVGNLPPG